jgi:hypothetical protein
LRAGPKRLLRLVIATILVGLAAGGCGESRSAVAGLSGGVESAPIQTVTVPADCRGQVERVRREWEAQLTVGAEQDPTTRFPNLTRAQFEKRLGEAEATFGFRVVEFEWLMPVQAAPVVVVQWDDPARLEDLTALEAGIEATYELLDPTQQDARGPTGGDTFEGFYFEARDSEGMPFLAIGNYSRGDDQAGARWTRFHEFVLRGPPPAVAPPQDLVCL